MRLNPIWWLGFLVGKISARYRHGHYTGFTGVCRQEHELAGEQGEHKQELPRGLFLVMGGGEDTIPPPGEDRRGRTTKH